MENKDGGGAKRKSNHSDFSLVRMYGELSTISITGLRGQDYEWATSHLARYSISYVVQLVASSFHRQLR